MGLEIPEKGRLPYDFGDREIVEGNPIGPVIPHGGMMCRYGETTFTTRPRGGRSAPRARFLF